MPDVYNSSYTGTQIDTAIGAVINKGSSWDGKQDKLTGTQGQVVGFDSDGDAVAMPAPDTGVTTFNNRTGAVTPQAGDYTADMVGAVPTSRTVNGQALSANITLDAEDVGARPESWTPTAADVGAMPEVSGGTTGQILTKTADGQEWADAPASGITETEADARYLQVSGNNSMTGGLQFWGDTYDYNITRYGTPERLCISAGSPSGAPIRVGQSYLALTSLVTPTNPTDAANKQYVDGKAPLTFANVAVTTSMTWSTHSITALNDAGYTQRVTVPLSGVTVNHSPDVRFAAADVYSGVWASYADTYAGGLYLYATENTATTIPTIIFTEVE